MVLPDGAELEKTKLEKLHEDGTWKEVIDWKGKEIGESIEQTFETERDETYRLTVILKDGTKDTDMKAMELRKTNYVTDKNELKK